jgi:hypothetical protein
LPRRRPAHQQLPRRQLPPAAEAAGAAEALCVNCRGGAPQCVRCRGGVLHCRGGACNRRGGTLRQLPRRHFASNCRGGVLHCRGGACNRRGGTLRATVAETCCTVAETPAAVAEIVMVSLRLLVCAVETGLTVMEPLQAADDLPMWKGLCLLHSSALLHCFGTSRVCPGAMPVAETSQGAVETPLDCAPRPTSDALIPGAPSYPP